MKNIQVINDFATELRQNGYDGTTIINNGYLGFLFYKRDEKDNNNVYLVHHGDLMYNDALVSLKMLKARMLMKTGDFINQLGEEAKGFFIKESEFILKTINNLI